MSLTVKTVTTAPRLDVGQLHHKCNRLRLHWKYNHGYNRDYICLETSSDRKQNPFAWIHVFQTTYDMNECNKRNCLSAGINHHKKKNNVNVCLDFRADNKSVASLEVWARGKPWLKEAHLPLQDQHAEKNPEKWWLVRMWMAILKPFDQQKILRKMQNTTTYLEPKKY